MESYLAGEFFTSKDTANFEALKKRKPYFRQACFA
jgi:hypothetical protein